MIKKDLIGQKFGRLKVIEKVKIEGRKDAYWRCQCSCGNESTQNTYVLNKGLVVSCGCYNKDMSQKRFLKGYEKILTKEYLEREFIEKARSLRSISQEVGCTYTCVKKYLTRNNLSVHDRRNPIGKGIHDPFKGYKQIQGIYWRQIISNAAKRNLSFNITIEQIWNIFEKQNGKCVLSGLPITLKIIKRKQTASLDRIDSTKGYEPTNVQWVHIDINKLKSNLPEDKLLYLCECIVKTKNSKVSGCTP